MTTKLLVLAFAIQTVLSAQVASVRIAEDRGPCNPATNPAGCTYTSPWGESAFTARNASLELLVSMAYNIPDKQISGMDRLGDRRYDVSIKPENGAATYEQVPLMLRALLEERFKLAVHRETKQVSGYVLVIGKGGPKLKKSAPDANARGMIIIGRLVSTKTDLDGIAALLARPLDQPVVNKTGIPGDYDVDLSFAPVGTDPSTTRPSIFTAVQEQLGLKLESQKVSVETLVIEHCERIPTEN